MVVNVRLSGMDNEVLRAKRVLPDGSLVISFAQYNNVNSIIIAQKKVRGRFEEKPFCIEWGSLSKVDNKGTIATLLIPKRGRDSAFFDILKGQYERQQAASPLSSPKSPATSLLYLSDDDQ
ncbi:MAG: hypothetical protein NTX86_01015 [Candidatus Dependentiae bacterium]|nr:hypothetical protein [Candidatus Dependentiae bacterium]